MALTDREFERLGRANSLVFAGALQATVVLTDTPADRALPSVTLTAPEGVAISRVFAAVSWRKQVDSSSATNSVAGNQQIRVRSDAPGPFVDAISIPTGALHTSADATEGGLLVLGAVDIKDEAALNGVYEFQWEGAQAGGDALTLHDVQTYLVVEFS
jgi:hypothetical protein